MNVLWLDDARERTKVFRMYAPYAYITETATECIEVLGTVIESWDIVFLDHDLGGETFVDPSHPNTGSAVVRWIAEHKPKMNRVIVHSCNPDAGKYMVEDLIKLGYNAERIPITTLVYEKVGDKNLLEVILSETNDLPYPLEN